MCRSATVSSLCTIEQREREKKKEEKEKKRKREKERKILRTSAAPRPAP